METTEKQVIQGNEVRGEDVREAFSKEAFCQVVQEILDQWEAGSQAERAELADYAEELRAGILGAVEDVMDADDLRTVLCHLYIKQKCEWIVMNNQINYSLLCRGVALDGLMYRAAVLAQHLAPLEPLVGREAIASIADFLAQPISPEV
ncbi:MAG: hypothetical protein ACON4Z_08615 [Planctomycetota bacterium]